MTYKVNLVCNYVFNIDANSEAEARNIANHIDSRCFEYGWCYENVEELADKFGFEYFDSNSRITEIIPYGN